MKTQSIIPAVTLLTSSTRRVHILTLLLLLSALTFQLSTFAQGTAFTYQGWLNDGASPATGDYDLTFTLFGASSGGIAVAGPVTNSPTGVTNGLFTVTLDLGANFPGADRWLEIGVRTNGPGPFTTLSARQKITAAPYAVTARNVTGVVPSTGLSGTYSSAVTFNNAGNSFSGSGAGLTSLNANNLSSGTVPSAALGNAWRISGNSGTTPANFLGTTDNQPLELRANGQRGLLLIPGITGFGVSVVAGSNTIEAILPSVAPAATISGGQGNLIRSGGFYSTISGGLSNMLDFSAQQAVIAGGIANRMGISANGSVIGGGQENLILSNTVLSVIAGGYTNTLGPFVSSSTIGGGQLNSIQTRTIDSVIGGGRFNRIQPTNESATIAGGVFNEIQTGGLESTIAGGSSHTIASNVQRAFIGGGNDHSIASHLGAIVGGGGHVIETNSLSSFIGGGSGNHIGAGANYATIPGGRENVASGLASFAAGSRAQALHSGSFVWADSSSSTPFPSTTSNQFLIRAQGGVGIGTTTPAFTLHVNGDAGKPGGGSWAVASDNRLKKNIRPLAGALDKLLALHGVNFEYIDPAKIHEPSGERIGLVAQEVEKVFPDWVETGPDGYKRVTVRGLEALVVEALRELQQKHDARLADELKRRDAENAELKRELGDLKELVNRLALKLEGGL